MGSIYYPIKINEFILEGSWPLSSFNRGLVRAWPCRPLLSQSLREGRGPCVSECQGVPRSESDHHTDRVVAQLCLGTEVPGRSWQGHRALKSIQF